MPIRKVLLVDDDPAVSRFTEIILRKLGKWHVVTVTGDEDTKWDMDMPDVVIADVGADAGKVVKTVATRFPGTPIVLLSGTLKSNEMKEFLQAGVVGVLKKPFDLLELPGRIRGMLRVSTAHTDFGPVEALPPADLSYGLH